ncbi:hypothetical protein OG195_44850 (plasmid) [Streptomyces sp. NBC_01362]|uniref:hypothetical protein n=1 Tax=Streptomyces sp. NBC_01362 TaxID=2903839 RepID=UPI002E318CB7|nr:hypothetical protein [Streptomyces sp. NBC_01362]
MTQPQMHATRVTVYTKGDFALFRDAKKFWAGQPGHTFVGRVERSWRHPETRKVLYDLVELSSNRPVAGVDPAYMRLLPAMDAMYDIDTAPLSEPDTGAMTPAAVAWLRQHLVQGAATLPAQR